MTFLIPPATDVIVVGDPRRAFGLAQELMVQPKMSHQSRGLWGYTGETEDGRPITVQSTGSGGPSAAAVICDLASGGATRIFRLGTCLAIDPDCSPGSAILVRAALAKDGTSRSLGFDGIVEPDRDLFDELAGLGQVKVISSHDLVARMDPDRETSDETQRPVARDLQTAATFATCRHLQIPAAAIVLVVEDRRGRRLSEDELGERFRDLGKSLIDRVLSTPNSNPQAVVDP